VKGTRGQGKRNKAAPVPDLEGWSKDGGERALDLQCAAEADVTVLITGRRRVTAQVARWIHQNGSRGKGRLVTVDCTRATCPPSIVPGLRLASDAPGSNGSPSLDGAVLLLQEVGAMAPDQLAELLHTARASRLEKKPGPQPSGVRIIATSSTDLSSDVAKGTFPEECFYCLNAIHLVFSKDQGANDTTPTAGSEIPRPGPSTSLAGRRSRPSRRGRRRAPNARS